MRSFGHFVDSNLVRNTLELKQPNFDRRNFHLIHHEVDDFGKIDASGFRLAFDARSDVHGFAKYVIALEPHLACIDSHADIEPLRLRHAAIVLPDLVLDRHARENSLSGRFENH